MAKNIGDALRSEQMLDGHHNHVFKRPKPASPLKGVTRPERSVEKVSLKEMKSVRRNIKANFMPLDPEQMMYILGG